MNPGTKNATVLRKAFSFGLVGVVNSLVDFGVFSLAYYALALPIIGANVASFAVAVTCSYVLNSKFTFAAESGARLGMAAYATFVLSQLAGFAGNTATVIASAYVIPVLLGKALAIIVSFLINFSLSHFVVFRQRG